MNKTPFHPSQQNNTTVRYLATIGMILSTLLLCSCRTSPPARPDYKVFVIIDDAGNALSQTAPFLRLPTPLTISVMPGCKATRETARQVRSTPNKQLMLHQPMEPINPNIDPGPGAILMKTPVEDIARILRDNIEEVAGATGMNNHMGSLVTQDRERMDATMEFCKANHLFFIDSFTISTSIAGKVAREHGVPTAQQNIFLDDDRSAEAIRKQFEKGLQIARNHGSVVMIGHAWSPETARVIGEMTAPSRNSGYSFHTLSDHFKSSR